MLIPPASAQTLVASESSSSIPASPAPAVAVSTPPSPSSDHDSGPHYSYRPRPEIEGGLSLMQGGYTPASANIGAGLNLEAKSFIATASASADNAHKQDSGTGHNTYAQMRAFYRLDRGWYFGGGAQWNNLTTDIYSKQAWRPAFGGGKDFFCEDFSLRTQVLYVLPGADHLNASQGPELSVWLPSPASRRHLFYHQTLGIYQAHQTSAPGDPGTNNRFVSVYAGFNAIYRF